MLSPLRSILIISTLFSFNTLAANSTIESFNKAKKNLERRVYSNHRVTLYCEAKFDIKKNIILPKGFKTDKYVKRSKRVEWEHVVPAQNFGRAFPEWREGHESCVNSKGKSFKGRSCASKVNIEYRYMQSDMFNLYPAIGAVNALRSNYNFKTLPLAQSVFGLCDMRIDGRNAQPPEAARGKIARTYMYMEKTYRRYNMSKSQRKLMAVWDRQYPVSDWECQRARKIAQIQGNTNTVVKSRCDALGK